MSNRLVAEEVHDEMRSDMFRCGLELDVAQP